MPKVPTYVSQINPRPLQGSVNVSIPENAFGSAAGILQAAKNIEGMASEFDRRALKEKADNDKRVAKETYLKAKDALRVQMYGTGQNGEPLGQLNLQGEDAKDVVANSKKALEKIRQEQERNLTNQTQRDLFSNFFDGDEQSTLDKAYSHQQKQMTDVDVKTTNSLIEDATQDMIEAHTPEEFKRAQDSLVAHSKELAKLQGLPEETRANIVEKQISVAHTNRISSMLAVEDYAGAREYMKRNSDAILPDARTGLEAKIVDGEQTRKAFDIGMTVFNSMPGASLQAKIAEARKQAGDNFDVEKGAVNWVKSLHSEQERARREYRDGVENMFRDAAARAQTPEELHAVEVQALAIVDPEARQKALGAVRAGGKSPETSNQDKFTQAEKDIASGMTVQELEAKYWRFLDTDDMKLLKDRIGNVAGARVNSYMLGLQQSLETEIPGTSDTAKNNRKTFLDAMKLFVKTESAQNDGRQPSDKELDEHKQRLFKERVYDENWWGDNTIPQYLLGTKKIGDIPEKDAKFLDAYWRGKGLTGEELQKKVEESYRDGRYLDTDEYKAVK